MASKYASGPDSVDRIVYDAVDDVAPTIEWLVPDATEFKVLSVFDRVRNGAAGDVVDLKSRGVGHNLITAGDPLVERTTAVVKGLRPLIDRSTVAWKVRHDSAWWGWDQGVTRVATLLREVGTIAVVVGLTRDHDCGVLTRKAGQIGANHHSGH